MDHMAGILFGLGAALCHSVAYIFSRIFIIERRDAVIRLLVASHLIMALISIALLSLVWSADVPPLRTFALPLLGAAAFYLVGQVGLLYMMKGTDASRVAPLLGFKIVILGLIFVFFMGQHLGARQWIAVLMSTSATLILSQSGSVLSRRVVVWLLVTCTAYSLSDLSIAQLVKSLAPLSHLRASLVGVCLSYILCGAVAVCFIPMAGGKQVLGDWKHAAPFAGAWLLAMIFLYACFGLIGPVYGNILQSTRGIISIVLGVQLARMGYEHLEQRVSRLVFVRRIGAAVLMCLAIWLFKS